MWQLTSEKPQDKADCVAGQSRCEAAHTARGNSLLGAGVREKQEGQLCEGDRTSREAF